MLLPTTADVCIPLHKLTYVETEWLWNGMYQDLDDNANDIIRQNACLKFYDTSKPLYLEANASGIAQGIGLLQVRGGMSCK